LNQVDIEIDGVVVQSAVGVGGPYGPFGPYANGSTHTVRLLHGSDATLHANLGYTTPNISCNDNDPTTSDVCVSNACQHVATPCDDGNPCTINDHLVANGTEQNFDLVTAPALPVGWTTSGTGTSNPWMTATDFGAGSAPNSAKTLDPASVSEWSLFSPVFTMTVPSTTLTFTHRWTTESGFDGGVLEIKIGAGPSLTS
jgi:hypothetical protein